jgi:hypothetical protein
MAKIKVISRKELSELLDMKAATLRSHIHRKQIKESKEGFINVFNQSNQDWIVDYCSKKGVDIKPIFSTNGKPAFPKKKPTPQQLKIVETLESEIGEKNNGISELRQTAYSILRDDKIKKETEVKVLEAELKQLELNKKKAKVVPIDFTIEMFNMYMKGNINGIINNGNSLIENLIDELEGSYSVKLKYKKAFKSMISEVINNNHGSISDEIINKAKDYAISTKW